MNTGNGNSGWHFVKYAIYSDEDTGKREAELQWKLSGLDLFTHWRNLSSKQTMWTGAAKLLNAVRKRNYKQ